MSSEDFGFFGQFGLRRYRTDYPEAPALGVGNFFRLLLTYLVAPGAAVAYAFTGWPGSHFCALLATIWAIGYLVIALVAPHASGLGTPDRSHPAEYWAALVGGLVFLPLALWRVASAS